MIDAEEFLKAYIDDSKKLYQRHEIERTSYLIMCRIAIEVYKPVLEYKYGKNAENVIAKYLKGVEEYERF